MVAFFEDADHGACDVHAACDGGLQDAFAFAYGDKLGDQIQGGPQASIKASNAAVASAVASPSVMW